MVKLLALFSKRYGIVKTGVYPNDKISVKFLYKSKCITLQSAKKEYIIIQNIYNSYKIFWLCNNIDNICVIKPIIFIENGANICVNYNCALILYRFFPSLVYNGGTPEHLINTLVKIMKEYQEDIFMIINILKPLFQKIIINLHW